MSTSAEHHPNGCPRVREHRRRAHWFDCAGSGEHSDMSCSRANAATRASPSSSSCGSRRTCSDTQRASYGSWHS